MSKIGHSVVYVRQGFLYYRDDTGAEVGIFEASVFQTPVQAVFYYGPAPDLPIGQSMSAPVALDIGDYLYEENVDNGTQADMGIIDWYLNDDKIISNQDWYGSPSGPAPAPATLTIHVKTSGINILKVTTVGKNAASSGTKLGSGGAQFTRL